MSRYLSLMAASRQRMNVDLDAEVASILRSRAAEAHVSEGEIVDRAIRAYDLRSLVAHIRARSDLDEDFPRAVADQLAHGDVQEDFMRALWDVRGADGPIRLRRRSTGNPRPARHQRRRMGHPGTLHRLDAQRLKTARTAE